MTAEAKVLSRIEEEAAQWLVRRDQGLTAQQEDAFEAWLAADDRHLEAFAQLDGALARLEATRETGVAAPVVAELAEWEQRRTRAWWARPVAWWGAAAAILVVGGMLYLSSRFTAPEAMPSRAVVIQPVRETLPDGSVVERNQGAEIRVAFEPTRRVVELLRGEAHFAVAKNKARPFIVQIGAVQVQAVGTAFSIRFDPKEVEVLVTEGRVSIATPPPAASPAAPPAAPVYLDAGYRTVIPFAATESAPAIDALTPDAMKQELAWRVPRYELSNTPLSEAVELFNRDNQVKLVIGDPDLASLRVSGLYWADSPDGFARLIAGGLEIDTVQESPDRIVFKKR